MRRSFYGDLREVLPNPKLAEEIGERITQDGVLFAFAGFYAHNHDLKLSEVLANMVLHMSKERELLEGRLRDASTRQRVRETEGR